MKKQLFALLLGSFFCVNGYSQVFSGGDGSTDSPYLIKKVADLTELATVVNGGNTLSGKLLRLENDITYGSSDTYTTIGFTGSGIAKKFAGTFDGNGHSINGLKLNGAKYVSMFASLDAAGIIKNLTLNAPTLTCTDSYGAFIAAQAAGSVENCKVENGIMTSTSGSYKGGIVGYLQGKVKDCSFSGSITTSVSIGGVVGQNYGDIDNCVCSATIISQSDNSSSVHIGGIASVTLKLGDTSPTITECYFIGSIQGSVLNNCGGISATLNRGTIERCWNGGYISSTGYCGGIIGSLDAGTIKDCYNAGTLYDTNSEGVGGIAGYKSTASDETIIENCLSIGGIFNSILARNEGSEIVGKKMGEVIINNTFFDTQVTGWNSIDHAKTTKELTTANGISGFDGTIWKFTEGMYPRLIKSAQEDVAILNATPFYLADGEKHGKVYSDFTVSTANDIEWNISSSLAVLNGNTVKVTRGSKIENVTITSYLGNYEKRSLISIYPRIFDGEGTENNPYLIKSKEDMMKLSDATNTQEISFTGEYFKMTQDIDMELDKNFIPFCFTSDILAFDGIFDGNGHAIKNLYIDTQTGQALHSGLFRTIFRNGVVKNLTIDKSCQLKIYRNFGPFVETLYGTLDNCYNYAAVTTAKGYSGGIAAFVQAGGVIRNCYNEGSVSADSDNGFLGGIAYNNDGTIENCQNNGEIIAFYSKAKNAGGIAGTNNGIIKNVLNAGRVTASDIVGGICATNAGQLINVLSLAPVTATATKDNLGSITGTDNGAQYTNVYYDKQIVIYKDILKNVNGITTGNLTKASWKGFGDDEAWSYTDGKYPVLKSFMNTDASELASIPVIFASEDNRLQISSDIILPAKEELVWTLKNGSTFSIGEGSLKYAATNTYASDTLTGTYNGYQKILPISTLGNILEGKGTNENPWLISSAGDLIKLSTEVNKSQNNYDGKYFKITEDINMSGSSFIPVAADGITTFNGIVDGNNKTITNLVINLADNSYVGLFGRVGAEGQISNLTIGEGSAVNGKQYVGAFAGSMDGYLTNCKNYASVSATNGNAGGFVGIAYQNVTLSGLTNEGNVSNAKDMTGGIVAEIKTNANKINQVVNRGEISGISKTGGIVGSASNVKIMAASNEGKVTGKTNVGGIGGYLTGTDTICDSFNSGEINGETEIGGIAGYNYKSYSDNEGYFHNLYNAGNVTASSSTAAGILGRGTSPEISACFNVGNITNSKNNLGSTTPGAGGIIGKGNPVITDCYNMGIISAYNNVGGIIAYPNSSYSEMTITNCYSAGPIICTNTGSANAGAILGGQGKLIMNNCYYDRQVIGYSAIGKKEDENETGINTESLTKTDFGSSWSSLENCYPVLTAFSSDNYAKLYRAAILLSNGETEDTYANVTGNFKLSSTNEITWTGDDVFTINGENVGVASNTKGDFKLTAELGQYKREITLTLNTGTSSIEKAENNAASCYATTGGVMISQPTEYAIFTVSGILLQQGKTDSVNRLIQLEKGVYFIKSGNKVYKVAVEK